MWLISVAGGIMILIGIVQIAFPDFARSIDKFSNDLEGVQTNHGERYEMARVGRALLMIVLGLVVMLMPMTL